MSGRARRGFCLATVAVDALMGRRSARAMCCVAPIATFLAVGCTLEKSASESISLKALVTLGDTDGDGALAGYPVVSPALDGMRIVVQPDGAPTPPRLFDARGRFVRLLGREGSGPGEFRRPAAVLVSGDSTLIVDTGERRLVVWNHTLGAVRAATWRPFTFRLIELADGSLVSTDALWRPGRPYEHYSRSGEFLSAFGGSLAPDQRGAHLLSAMPDGSFWTAPRIGRLRFTQWRAPGEPLMHLDVETPHFAPYDEYVMAGTNRPPSPSLRGFWADTTGYLWLVIEIPDERWDEGYGAPQRGEGGREYRPLTDQTLAWDAVILQVESATGRVVAEGRFEEALAQVVEPGIVARVEQDDDGWYRIRLYGVQQGQE